MLEAVMTNKFISLVICKDVIYYTVKVTKSVKLGYCMAVPKTVAESYLVTKIYLV